MIRPLTAEGKPQMYISRIEVRVLEGACNMFKDIKKTIQTINAFKYRTMTAPRVRYFDGFELLNERLHPVRQILRIVDKQKISSDVTLIRGVSVNPDKPLAPFRAGQYLGVKVIINGIQTGRAYSLVSSPNNLAYYEIAVKTLGSKGFVSAYLCDELKIGDSLEITEPLGHFYYNRLFHGKRLVFIAGGCGITPFISLLRDFYEQDSDIEIFLIYGCLTEKDILFQDEIRAMIKKKPNFHFSIVLSNPEAGWKGYTGFITKKILKEVVGTFESTMLYIVGPEAMRDFLIHEMADFKLQSNKIVWEVSPPIADITKMIGWPKDIKPDSQISCKINWTYGGSNHESTIKISATEPLLNSIERANLEGIIVNNACRAGECNFCRTHLKSGKVFVPPSVHIREADQIYGYIHACVSYPISDCEIELYPQNLHKMKIYPNK
jgi:glycine betaine catabolism B